MKAETLKDLIERVIGLNDTDQRDYVLHFVLYRKYIPEDEVQKLKEENVRLKEIVKEVNGCQSCQFLALSGTREPCNSCIDKENLPKWEYKDNERR